MLGTTDNQIALIEPFDGKLLCKINEPINDLGTGQILEAGFSPDSRYLVSGSENAKQKIYIWNLEGLPKDGTCIPAGSQVQPTEVKLMDFHPTTVAAVKFSHVYCMLVSAC
jgi:WD40 repeat protein